jgi:hypothetical protein
MRPLHWAAVGVVLMALDFRTTSLDLLPDVVGWVLLGYALHQLLGPRALPLAAAGGALSLSTLLLPYHYVQIDPFTGERVVVGPDTDLGYAEVLEYDRLEGGRLAMAAGATTLAAVTFVVLAWTAARRATARGAVPSARRLQLGVGAIVVLWAVPQLVGMALAGGDGYDVVWDDGAGRVALVGLVAALAFAGLLFRDGREPWALRPGTERTLPSARAQHPA